MVANPNEKTKQNQTITDAHPPVSEEPARADASFDTEPQEIVAFDRDTPAKGVGDTKGRQSNLRDVFSIGGVMVGALAVAFFLIAFVFQSYQVDGPSMQTTLQTGDHLFVWKVPRTIARITHHQYVPHRGDVIVFNQADLEACGSGTKKQLIKRVIALPGERVVYSGTDVTVYNKDNPNGFNPDKTMPYGSKLINENPSEVDVTVGNDQLFVSGDHRDNSCDSRAFGPIATSSVVGKLAVRVLPAQTFTVF